MLHDDGHVGLRKRSEDITASNPASSARHIAPSNLVGEICLWDACMTMVTMLARLPSLYGSVDPRGYWILPKMRTSFSVSQ